MADTLSILQALSTEHFTSGAALAERFQCSRATISGALALSETYGIALERKHGVGYRLIPKVDWLDQRQLQAQLATNSQLQIRCTGITDSTNRQLLQNPGHGLALAAEWQTAGRGRRGRNWQGQIGSSLLFSLCWQFDGGPSQLAGLPLVVGLSVAQTLARLGVQDIALKWPNDLLLPMGHGWGKVGGILIEMQGDALGPSLVVIGIGLNVLAPPADVDQQASSLSGAGLGCTRNALLANLLQGLEQQLLQFAQDGFTDALIRQWESRHAWQGCEVEALLANGSRQRGKAVGLSADGNLRLATGAEEILLGSGDVSLRQSA
ncbi:biotin--[acetyl-CoA-carboxylase] ligase [Chitinilyticum piscinae]|uniref:biotin--[biotin carboxyl-carrier protein] ligase n=1 Tax=Chitinilyticum piscinae TaxID=2866724 RepID=A0A8J7KDB6_9NEIS|nr:biotin--[acetyl-CoA-carboxylase] ligase [Chitinilyticum piscinae]MBE9608619.1 biotin--[acetyl-CoA-carboxylase] ligase [Chitinilyticum piscinae]